MGDPKNNRVEVTTKHFKENGMRYPAYRLSIQGINGYYYLTGDNNHRKTASEMPDYPKKGQVFISEPGTIIAVRTNIYQSGGVQNFKSIVDKYVICPEIPIHYEGMDGTYDYKTEQEFMDEIHEFVPKPLDGLCQPLERLSLSEAEFQELQQQYPTVVWEEKPSIVKYCLPLDYFDPTIKGVTVAYRAEGKGIWQANGLDERYVPEVRLKADTNVFTPTTVELIINFTIPNIVKYEMIRRIIPAIDRQLQKIDKKLDVNDYNYADKILSETSLSDMPSTHLEEIRVYKASLSSYTCMYWEIDSDLLMNQSWSWKMFQHQGLQFPTHTNAHNGIWIDHSATIPFGTDYVTNTCLMLKDEYCPGLNLSRDRIDSMPTEVSCRLELLACQIQSNIQQYFDLSDRFKCACYPFIHDSQTPVKEYWEVLERIPNSLFNFRFKTKSGIITLFDIDNILKEQDMFEIFMSRDELPFFKAVLMKRFDLRADYSDNEDTPIYVIKRTENSLMDKLSGFPPLLFIPPIKKDMDALTTLTIDYVFDGYYNANHPFAVWLTQNQIALQNAVPGIYNQLIKQLRGGPHFIENINSILSQLRQIPHLGIKIADDLTENDFIQTIECDE